MPPPQQYHFTTLNFALSSGVAGRVPIGSPLSSKTATR